MLKRLAGWYRDRQRKTRILLGVVVMAAVLEVGYWGVHEAAQRIADHVTVTVICGGWCTDGPQGVVYEHTFGRALAADAEHLLDDDTTPYVSSPEDMRPWTGTGWDYHIEFTWHGVLIETVNLQSTPATELYYVTTLGFPDLRPRMPPNGGSLLGCLIQDSGGAIPWPHAAPWNGVGC